jgi:hypothetical protein
MLWDWVSHCTVATPSAGMGTPELAVWAPPRADVEVSRRPALSAELQPMASSGAIEGAIAFSRRLLFK